MSILTSLKEKFLAYQKKKQFPDSMCLQRARFMIKSDAQWMSHDPLAAAIYKRIEDLIAEDWYKRSVDHSSKFRQEIGLEPNYQKDQKQR